MKLKIWITGFNYLNKYLSKIYIIGGMVDHNRLKNATFDLATVEGI